MSKPKINTHPCPGGCGGQITAEKLACRTDWWRLPKSLREAITRNYRRNRTAHAHAMAAALAWYRDNVRDGAVA